MNPVARFLLVIGLATMVAGSVAAEEILNLNKNRGGFFVGANFARQGGDMDNLADDLAEFLEQELGGSWTANNGAKLGFGLGGYYVFHSTPTFGVEIEGQYIQRGTKIDISTTLGNTEIDGKAEFKINYLEVPVLARFSPSPAARARVVFLVGPVFGIKTGANLETTVEDESDTQSMSDEIKNLNFGLLGGIGVSAQVGTDSYLVVQARYFLGLSNPIEDDEYQAKSSDFGIFVGMEFTPKK